MKTIERRATRVELRVQGEGKERRLAGHAAVFNSLSEDLGGFREKIAPGAFAATLAEDDIRALWNHDANFVLGRNKAGTLKLAEDAEGLAIGIFPPDTQAARDLMVSIERGDVTGMSIGFITISDEWQLVDGEAVRTLRAVQLFDVSPVTFPAYPQTDVAVRALGEFRRKIAVPDLAYVAAARRRRLDLIIAAA